MEDVPEGGGGAEAAPASGGAGAPPPPAEGPGGTGGAEAVEAGAAPEDWRDWGDRLGEGLPIDVLAKVAEKLVAQTEAGWAGQLKREGNKDGKVREMMAERKRDGNCLFPFAMVCKPWRKVQLKVGGPLRTRVKSDVILPGRVALAKWALAEGCPQVWELGSWHHMAHVAAEYGHLQLVKWLCREGGFAMDEGVMNRAARSGNLELVQWLRGEGCPWSYVRSSASRSGTCFEAVNRGHVEVLRWVRENGCPWHADDRDTAAAKLGYTDDFGNLDDEYSD